MKESPSEIRYKRIPSPLQSGHCRRTRSLSLSHMNINNIRERRAILILILILYTKNYVLCILCIKYNNIWFWGEYFLFLFLCSVFVAKVCAIHMLELFSLSGFWVLFLCLPTAFFSPFCFVLYVCALSLSLSLSGFTGVSVCVLEWCCP